MPDQDNQQRKASTSISIFDVAAGIYILMFLPVLWWLKIDPISVSFSIFPLQAVLFFIGLIPFVCCAVWLENKFYDILHTKIRPYYLLARFLVMLFAIVIPIALIKTQK